MKKIIILMFVIFGMYHCKPIFGLDTLNLGMLPLNTGNVWVYSVYNSGINTGVKIQHKVAGDTIILGTRFSVIINESSLPYNGPLPRYIKMDTVNVSLYKYENGSICMFDSLQCNPGGIADICNHFTRRVESRGTTDLFGVHIARVKFTSTNDANQSRYYASSLGIYLSYDDPIFYHLIGCVVDNIVYGDTSLLTGINQISSEIPDKFSLYQNYPNPFNPVTKIKFQIPQSKTSHRDVSTSLIVYDILGTEVQVLVNQNLQPGSYEIDYDGSNLPSGVYYYKLENNSFSETKKMVLIK